VNVVLISTYELGRQPFGLASPAAWLRERGASVTCLDLSREAFREAPVRAADLVAFYVPMHTATRLAVQLIEPVRRLNPSVHVCFYGLYAPMNESYLRELGVETILGGEFEEGLSNLIERLPAASSNAETKSFPGAGLRAPSAGGPGGDSGGGKSPALQALAAEVDGLPGSVSERRSHLHL